MLVQGVHKSPALAWGKCRNSGEKRMNRPVLQWPAMELVQSLCETSLKPVKLNVVVSVLLVEQFPSWNVAHQQYRNLRCTQCLMTSGGIAYAVNGWIACLIQGRCLCKQVSVYKIWQGIQFSRVYYSCAEPTVLSPQRPGLAYREPGADRTPRYAQSWKELSGLTVALVLRLLFSPVSWFGLFLLFPLLSELLTSLFFIYNILEWSWNDPSSMAASIPSQPHRKAHCVWWMILRNLRNAELKGVMRPSYLTSFWRQV